MPRSHLAPILAALDAVLADTPERLMPTSSARGSCCAAAALGSKGSTSAIAAATGIEVHRDSQPHLCAVRGTGYALDNLDVLKRALMYIR